MNKIKLKIKESHLEPYYIFVRFDINGNISGHIIYFNPLIYDIKEPRLNKCFKEI